jgi:hypothetical protein
MCPVHKPSASPPIITADLIVERDDGMFALGIGDEAHGPFQAVNSRNIASQMITPPMPITRRLAPAVHLPDHVLPLLIDRTEL